MFIYLYINTYISPYDMNDLIGYILALIIGISLGLIGSGGSILTVPILVYVMGVSPVLSTAYSLFIVGTTSLAGGIQNALKGRVSFKTAIVFAVPSFVGVYVTRRWLVPLIPETITHIGDIPLTRDLFLMLAFAILMILAAFSMIRSGKEKETENENAQHYNFPLITLEGLMVGVLTGLVGAGGGFLIIPALVLLAKLPMKLAVGTSLFIIAAKSLIGFIGDVQSGQVIDWKLMIFFTGFAIVGIFIGGYLSRFIPGEKLKKGFGWFVLAMGTYILTKELFFS